MAVFLAGSPGTLREKSVHLHRSADTEFLEGQRMFKKIAALTLAAMVSGSAYAADEAKTETVVRVVQTPATTTVRRAGPARRFFSRMMELERRKNAWLRSVFLNR